MYYAKESRHEMKQPPMNQHRAGSRMLEILALKKTSNSSHNQSWLLIYLDIVTLLLAMFILLINQPQQESMVEEPELLKEQLQTEQVKIPVPAFSDDLSDKIANSKTLAPEADNNIANQLLQQIEAIQGEEIIVQVEAGKINVRLPESILFETGKSDLLKTADSFLEKIVPILKQHSYPISIEGHTDNIPIASKQFPSNWELSAARASIVVRKLGEQGINYSRLKAIGYADTIPIASNETIEGRRNNRRVNLIIEAVAN